MANSLEVYLKHSSSTKPTGMRRGAPSVVDLPVPGHPLSPSILQKATKSYF